MDLIVDNIVELRPLHLGIGGGEPLLSPYLGETLRKITERMGKDTPMITIDSMILYDHEPMIDLVRTLNERLPDKRIGFYLSVHGTEEVHDAMVGVKGHFQRVMESIELLKKHEVRFGMGFVPTRYNIGDIDAMFELALKVGATVFNVSQFVPVGRGQYDFNLTPQQFRTLITWVVLQNRRINYRFVVTHEHWIGVIDEELFHSELFVGCSAGIYYFGLRSNGDIVPCQLSTYVLGNIRSQPLLHVWQNHPALAQWRQRQVKGRCESCQFLFKCGGCRCNAVAYTGDFLGEDPLCPFSSDELSDFDSRMKTSQKEEPSSTLFLDKLPEFTEDSRFVKVPSLSTSQADFLAVRHEPIDSFVKLTGDARIIYELFADGTAFTFAELKRKFKEKTGRDLPLDEFKPLVKYKLVACLE